MLLCWPVHPPQLASLTAADVLAEGRAKLQWPLQLQAELRFSVGQVGSPPQPVPPCDVAQQKAGRTPAPHCPRGLEPGTPARHADLLTPEFPLLSEGVSMELGMPWMTSVDYPPQVTTASRTKALESRPKPESHLLTGGCGAWPRGAAGALEVSWAVGGDLSERGPHTRGPWPLAAALSKVWPSGRPCLHPPLSRAPMVSSYLGHPLFSF